MFKTSKDQNKAIPDSGQLNQINAGTAIEGNLTAAGNVRIDGLVKGTIECKGKVVIGETSEIVGNIRAVHIEIMGKVHGDIYATERTQLKSTCVLTGDIYTGALAIEPGATFNGACKMGHVSEPSTPHTPHTEVTVQEA